MKHPRAFTARHATPTGDTVTILHAHTWLAALCRALCSRHRLISITERTRT